MGAAMNGHEEVVKQLLSAGADVSLVNDEGETAMALANTNRVASLIRNEKTWRARHVDMTSLEQVPAVKTKTLRGRLKSAKYVPG